MGKIKEKMMDDQERERFDVKKVEMAKRMGKKKLPPYPQKMLKKIKKGLTAYSNVPHKKVSQKELDNDTYEKYGYREGMEEAYK